MDRTHDVAVIGAGPAGSTLAALLAGRGWRVALIDRDRFPRDKVCGELLSYDALPIVDRLGVDLRDSPTIRRCRLVGRKHAYTIAFPHPAHGISRLRLDERLWQAALDRGAEDLTGRTVTAVEGGTIHLEETSIRPTVIAGAWGRWGRLDQQLRRSFARDRTHRNFGFKRHYKAIDETDRETIELYSFRRGYVGVNAIEEGLTNICGLVHDSRLRGHRGRWETFVESIRNEEPPIDALYRRHTPAQDDFLSSDPVIFRARSSVEGGMFLIGDAAGLVDPLTGSGMAMAIESALLAASAIASVLERTQPRDRIENAYRAAHEQFFAARIRWSRAVARLISSPFLLNGAMRVARMRGIGELLLRKTRSEREEIDRMADRWFSVE